MGEVRSFEFPISGMDCADCTQHVQRAIAALPGVMSVNVLLASEKAIVQLRANSRKAVTTNLAMSQPRNAIFELDTWPLPKVAGAQCSQCEIFP